jgi:hypothetical protein
MESDGGGLEEGWRAEARRLGGRRRKRGSLPRPTVQMRSARTIIDRHTI